ncbi:uncharacterized protein LOC108197701 [Daucus carota subsp. sativus]|uniref:uncharacterized protein LOC108197701 n=1 Tax=Daucus carota subsp. sativus TaxID=79200 RepID=UPI0007F00E06|nr:PREDICTED: E3 ubiquitin-protein ligase RNF126-A-like [Daucus carota subsp. sativus]
MGCFCSCFRVPVEEDGGAVVVASGSQNRAPFSYMAQFFDNKYGVVSGNPSSAQTEVRTHTPRDASSGSSSSSRNLEFQQRVAVVEPGRGLRFLQSEQGPPEGHDVLVKRPYITTPEAGTNMPRGTLLPNSLRSRNLDLQGNVAVQGNGTVSAPLQLRHGPAEGHDVQVNVCSKSKDNAGKISKDDKAEALRFASPVNVSSERVETEYKQDFCVTRDEVECPTCLEEYTDENPKITSLCNHNFHLGCIYEWMERSTTCPMCFEEMKFLENI